MKDMINRELSTPYKRCMIKNTRAASAFQRGFFTLFGAFPIQLAALLRKSSYVKRGRGKERLSLKFSQVQNSPGLKFFRIQKFSGLKAFLGSNFSEFKTLFKGGILLRSISRSLFSLHKVFLTQDNFSLQTSLSPNTAFWPEVLLLKDRPCP
ncbi:hypothetical protein JGUZn3_09970 [Entomobacter blattae]|uniref:Uncharacterized protein n=1 Tax=Entomobacter blattae TaxID=2762277 RepID=A0A7H1NR17_9PROT|nr:hypothetical protein JGUZn3_09970 [Entomobacter blattae]